MAVRHDAERVLQDEALTPGTTDRRSVNTRILQMDVVTGVAREYVYRLDASNRGQGIIEILVATATRRSSRLQSTKSSWPRRSITNHRSCPVRCSRLGK